MTQKGKTMMETLMVLSIMGILTLVALVGYRWALRKHMANQAVKYIQTLAASSRSWLNVKAAQLDYSAEGTDFDIEFENNVLSDYVQEQGNLYLGASPSDPHSGFPVLPLDELISNVAVTDNRYFEVFENAKVTAMLTTDDRNHNDIDSYNVVVNVENMKVRECKQLILSNVDADEIRSSIRLRTYYRCSDDKFSTSDLCPADNLMTLAEVAEEVCQPRSH